MKKLSIYVKLSFSLLAIIIGIVLLFFKNWMLNRIHASVLVLKPDSPIINLWTKTAEPIITDIYFFNWTNSNDFNNFTIIPKLEQCGPYKCVLNIEKTNIVWNSNDTVTFNRRYIWNLDENYKIGNLNDSITVLHVLAVSLAHLARYWSYFLKIGINGFFSAGEYETKFTKTVYQFLSGFEDGILNVGRWIPFAAPNIPRFEKFGLLSYKNGSDTFDGLFNIANGVEGNFDILNWNYKNKTSSFNDSCSQVRGSMGDLYSPDHLHDYIDIFIPEICRSVRLDFERKVKVFGIDGYKYKVGRHALDNGSSIPGNKCYCAGDCIPSGMINISSCQYGLPYFISLPHFYSADPVYINSFVGLNPEKEKHEAYLVIEPRTGILLKAVVRAQINLLVQSVEDIALFENVQKLYFPLVWGEQIIVLPKMQQILLKTFLAGPVIIITTSIALIALGTSIVASAIYYLRFIGVYSNTSRTSLSRYSKHEEQPLQEKN